MQRPRQSFSSVRHRQSPRRDSPENIRIACWVRLEPGTSTRRSGRRSSAEPPGSPPGRDSHLTALGVPRCAPRPQPSAPVTPSAAAAGARCGPSAATRAASVSRTPRQSRPPQTRRTLHVGEQKGDHPRRGHRRISGHPRRISQQTRRTSYIAGMPLQTFGSSGDCAERAYMPTGLRSRDNELLDRSSGKSRAAKDGVMWQRTGPFTTPVPIVHAFPRATTMSTTRHTTYRSGRSVKLPRRVESIPTGGTPRPGRGLWLRRGPRLLRPTIN